MPKFGRTYELQVGPVTVSGLDCSFEVTKTKAPKPATCKIELYNLSRQQRRDLAQLSVIIPEGVEAKKVRGKISCVLAAGYDTREVIFSGNLRTAQSKKEGPTWVTTLEGADAGVSFLTGRVSQYFPAGSPVLTVVRACVEAMGVGVGNLPTYLATRAGDVFPEGTTLYGKASEELKGLLASCGYTYSVNNGVLQVHGSTVPVTDAVVLNNGSGLVSTPYANPDGTMRVRALLVPGLYPGAAVEVQSPEVDLNGQFEIWKVTYKGDRAGKEWYADMDLKVW